jgi:hypothetical protein
MGGLAGWFFEKTGDLGESGGGAEEGTVVEETGPGATLGTTGDFSAV